MLYGATIGQADRAMRPDDLARALEERGFDSFFLPEHTHTPAAQRTEYPGGHRDREEWSSYDPFVALAIAAAAGVDRVVFLLLPRERDVLLPLLDQHARLMV